MHPLEKHHHQQPEYLNHIMMRFGHHLSAHQQQTFSTHFSGGMSSSCQGSRIQKKLSSVTAQQQQQQRRQQHQYPSYYRNQLTNGGFPFKKPVVHMSRTSIPQQQQQRISINDKDEEKKKATYSSITTQQDVTMKETTSLYTASSCSTDSITMTTTRSDNINSINAGDNKVKKLSNSTEKDKEL